MKNGIHELEFLIFSIEDALKLTWEETTDGPLIEVDHEHCMIYWDVINPKDEELKARSTLIKTIKKYDQSGKITTLHSNPFLCYYCYDRFIKNNGIEELKNLKK